MKKRKERKRKLVSNQPEEKKKKSAGYSERERKEKKTRGAGGDLTGRTRLWVIEFFFRRLSSAHPTIVILCYAKQAD